MNGDILCLVCFLFIFIILGYLVKIVFSLIAKYIYLLKAQIHAVINRALLNKPLTYFI